MDRVAVFFVMMITLFFWSCSDESSTEPDITPPSIKIIHPVNNSIILEGDTLTIEVEVSDNSDVSKVEFYINDSLKKSIENYPYSYDWLTNEKLGDNFIHAKAYDSNGNIGLSDTVNVNIVEKYINITSPILFEARQMGQNQIIEWNSNIKDILIIELFRGGDFIITIENEAENNGSFSWLVPSTLEVGMDYKIKLTSSNDNFVFSESEHFVIIHSQEMIYVQGGTFQMGDEIEDLPTRCRPVHDVILNDFFISNYEVTQTEWKTYSDFSSLGTYAVGDNYPIYRIRFYHILSYCNFRSIGEGFTPCYSIDGSNDPNDWGEVPSDQDSLWNEVICDWSANGYRLPTEAEWEYVARGGIGWDNGYTFSGSNNIDSVAWYSDNQYIDSLNLHFAKPVGTKVPNQLGIYDMTGNVTERCWDWNDDYGDYYQICDNLGTVTNPTGQLSPILGNPGRILRGGCFGTSTTCRNSFREAAPSDYFDASSGFRVVRRP